jgi:endonuclease YncB( thermonuclease family)
MNKLLCALILVFASLPALAAEFTARVIWVMDGDTVLVLKTGQKIKIRLANIDAPEKSQDFGIASRDALIAMVQHKEIQVEPVTIDKYGRLVALLTVDGLKVNEEQVKQGMAWEYSSYHSDRHYIALQQEAQQARRGLWIQPNPVPPWVWRKEHAQEHANEPGAPPVLKPDDYTCGKKHHCSQMRSCNEAHYYLTVCGVTALNPEGDGVPCRNLCMPGWVKH